MFYTATRALGKRPRPKPKVPFCLLKIKSRGAWGVFDFKICVNYEFQFEITEGDSSFPG